MSNCGCNKKPCGCKGTSPAQAMVVSGSCGCGGGGCATCTPRAFIRPRFFAGQLLTEDYYAINKLAGGMKGGAYKGCICGGISMGVLGRDQIDIKLDFDDVRFRGG